MAPLADVFIRIRADGRQAESELRRVRGDARRLDGLRITINIRVAGASASSAELERLKRQVQELQKAGGVKFTTRIDTEGLQRLAQQIARITVGVPAAVGALGVLGGAVASLGAGFFALGSAIAPAAASLAALPALAGAAAQGAGVAAASMHGIGDAVKAMMNLDKAAGLTAQQSASVRRAAAEQIREANVALANATRVADRTAIDGARAVRDASLAVADARVAAGERIEAAEDQLTSAQRASRDAQEDLNRARLDAKEALADLALELRGVALSEEDAQIGLERAQQRLAELRSGARQGSTLDMREADLNVRQAAQRLAEVQERHADLKAEVNDANKQGVEGAANVVRARERVQEAAENEREAVENVRRAQVEGAREIARAQRSLLAVQEQVAEANADAARAVAEAQREVANAAAAAEERMSAASSQAQALAFALSQLSPAGRDFAKFLHAEAIPALTAFRNIAQEEFLPDLTVAMRKLGELSPIVAKGIGATASVLGDLAIQGANMVTSGPWKRDFAALVDNNTKLVKIYGQIIFNLADAFRDVAVAAIPLANNIANAALKLTEMVKGFTAARRSRMAAFFEDVWDVLRQLGRIAGNLAAVFLNLGKAGSDGGKVILNAFEGATKKWREFTSSLGGQNKLKEFFDNSALTMIATGRLIAAIGVGLAKLGADPQTGKLIDQFKDQLLPALKELYKAVSGDLLPNIVTLATNITLLLAAMTREGGAAETFVSMINDMVEAFRALMDGPAGPTIGFMLKLLGFFAAFAIPIAFVGRLGAALKRLVTVVIGAGKGVVSFAKHIGLFGRAASPLLKRGGLIDGGVLRVMYLRDAFVKLAGKIGSGKIFDGIRLRLMYLGDAFKKIGGAIRSFGSGAFSRIAGVLGKVGGVIGKLTGAFGRLGSFLATKLPLFLRIATVAIRGFMTFLLGSNPIGWIILGVSAAVIALIAFYKRSEWFRGVVQKVMGKVRDAAAAVVQWFKDRWPAIKDVLTAVFDRIRDYVKTWLDIFGWVIDKAAKLIGWFRDKWPAIRDIITNPIRSAKTVLSTVWGAIRDAVHGFVSKLKSWVTDSWSKIKGILVNPISGAKDQLIEKLSDLYAKGKEKLQALVDFAKGVPEKMKSAFSSLGTKMKEGVGSGLSAVFGFIDRHLIGNLNKITSKFGVPIPEINFQGFARGGVVPGVDKGRDSQLIMARGGEGILTPKTTRAIGGAAGISKLNLYGEKGRLNGMGGAWGWIKGRGSDAAGAGLAAGRATGRAVGSAVDFAGDVAGQVRESLKHGYAFAVEALMNPFIDKFAAAFGGNWPGDTTVGALRMMRDAAVGKAHGAEAADTAGSGSLAPALLLAISKLAGGVAMPLRTGTYRVGAGFPRYPSGRYHSGQDFPAPTGTPVYAPIHGLLRNTALAGSYGLHANIFGSGGMRAILAHLSAFTRGNGFVRRGEMIGRVGSTGNSTGPHLHMEFRRGGEVLNPRSVLRYDTGGLLGPRQAGFNGGRKPERVLSGRQTEAFERLVDAFERGGTTGGRSMVVNVNVQPKQRRLGWEVGDAVQNTAILNGWV